MRDIPQRQDELTLAALPTAVGCARLFVRYSFQTWGIDREHIHTAERLVSELVLHALGPIGLAVPHPYSRKAYNGVQLMKVRLGLFKHRVVLEVWDRSIQPPMPRAVQGDGGLVLVPSIGTRWGYYYPEHGGRVVWSELAIGRPVSLDDTMELPRVLPKQQRRHRPVRPTEVVPDSELLRRMLEDLQELDSDTERED